MFRTTPRPFIAQQNESTLSYRRLLIAVVTLRGTGLSWFRAQLMSPVCLAHPRPTHHTTTWSFEARSSWPIKYTEGGVSVYELVNVRGALGW